MSKKIKAAIIGPGNIGTDLLVKAMRSEVIEPVWMIGVDPESPGLARAKKLGLKTTADGLDGMLPEMEADGVQIVFDATSAYVHAENSRKANEKGAVMIDLTPAAIGPYCVPSVNIDDAVAAQAMNVNMVTCGGQATIPIVAAVSRIQHVTYGEIVATVASKSAGPGTRKNIDEFTRTTAGAIEKVGGADKAKAIIVLNPAEPPLLMRNTVFTLCDPIDQDKVKESVESMVAKVQAYVPGYRLKQEVQFERFGSNNPCAIPGYGEFEGLKASIFLEVEGAGHYLPKYAGNLDIMTSAAMGTAEELIKLSS